MVFMYVAADGSPHHTLNELYRLLQLKARGILEASGPVS